MKHPKLISLVFLYGSLILLLVANILYDIWIISKYGEEASISAAMRDLPPAAIAGTFLATGLVLGFLVAHFWFGPPDGVD